MIRLGLRLTLNGGKEAAVRLVITAAAVALGVSMLLITLAGINALSTQNARAAWLSTGGFPSGAPSGPASTPAGVSASADPLWWLVNTDFFGSQKIYRVDVAATGSRSPLPPGLPRLPGPGQFYASPTLGQLLRATPAAELGDRFPGQQAGTIGRAALPAPNSLIIVIGHTAGQLSHEPGATEVNSIQTVAGTGHGSGSVGYNAANLQVILAVAALALLFPILVFIGTTTRLAAARREQRFAAMRLVGATPRQVSVISAVEAAVAALAGVAAGFGLFFLLNPPLTHVSFTGEPLFPGDLSLSLADILLVAIGVPAAAAAAARIALRRVRLSPLGVTRRVTPAAPRGYRVIPLLAGLGWLAVLVAIGRPQSTGAQTITYLLAFLLIMSGLIIAGPWLTLAGSRVMARRTSRPAVLIAGRRLSDSPRAAFRSISGLIVALFITSASVGIITTSLDQQGTRQGGPAARDTLVDHFDLAGSGQPFRSVPGAVLTGLRSIRGVQGVTAIHTDPLVDQPQNQAAWPGLVSCAQLTRTPGLGRCASGATAASHTPDPNSGWSFSTTTVWRSAAISPGRLQRLPVLMIAVGTNGSSSAIERARTALDIAFPYLGSPATIGENSGEQGDAELNHMTDVVILASLIIAGCSLAIAATAGLTDRQRPFSLLRLTGVPLGVLRRVVALESAVPLLVIAVVSAGTGFLAAGLFVRSELGVSLRPPGADYYVVVLAGIILSLGVIAATLPLLERITGPEAARSE